MRKKNGQLGDSEVGVLFSYISCLGSENLFNK